MCRSTRWRITSQMQHWRRSCGKIFSQIGERYLVSDGRGTKEKDSNQIFANIRKARGETSELFHGFTGNAKDPQKFSSAQSVALNLWSKRHCSAEERNENFILSKNNAIVNEIEGSSTVEYKTIKETFAKQRGRLEEFNLLCNNVEASLKAFWSR